MSRLCLVLSVAALAVGCSGTIGFVGGERSSSVAIQFTDQVSEREAGLLAFDPSRHSLDIEIAFPLEQQDDIDVFIVTSSGIRFHVLSSFQDCRVEGGWRRCTRRLPVLPDEGVDNWRVEAERGSADGLTSVEVAVTWVPVGS